MDNCAILPREINSLLKCITSRSGVVSTAAAHAAVRLPLSGTARQVVAKALHSSFCQHSEEGDAALELVDAFAMLGGIEARAFLRGLSFGGSGDVRRRALEHLNMQGDPLVVSVLRKEIGRDGVDRKWVARLLATAASPPSSTELCAIQNAQDDPVTRFWFELALARRRKDPSSLIALVRTMTIGEQLEVEGRQEGRWGTETSWLSGLHTRLDPDVRDAIRSGVELKQLAYAIAGYPQSPTRQESTQSADSQAGTVLPADEANVVGRRLIESKAWFDFDSVSLESPFESPEWLANMVRELAGHVVTAVLRNRLKDSPDRPEYLMDGGMLSACVIWMLPKDFEPNFVDLFEVYVEANELDNIAQLQAAAAAALRGELRDILSALEPTLTEQEWDRQRLAAEFIELFVRYKETPGIPTFGGGTGPGEPAQGDELGVQVFMRATVSISPAPIVEEWFTLRITLDVAQEGPVEVLLDCLDWDELELEVVVALGGAALKQPRSPLIVRRLDGHGYAEFDVSLPSGIRQPHAIEVDATFFHRGRYCGSLREAIVIGRKTEGQQIAIQGAAPPADLTVRIARPRGAQGTFWSFTLSPELRGILGRHSLRLDGYSELIGDSVTVFDRLFDEMITGAETGHVDYMLAIGRRIADLAPSEFSELYRQLTGLVGTGFSIQFITDHLDVPWEIMVLNGSNQPLSAMHPIARWNANHEGFLDLKLSANSFWTVAPEYSSPHELPSAQREAAALEAFGARRLRPATRRAFCELLEKLRHGAATLHFSGHGACVRDSPGVSSIELEDGALSAIAFEAALKGKWTGGFLILNACETGDGRTLYGVFGGWSDACRRIGCAGLLAPLWQAEDDVAALVVTRVMEDCIEGNSTVAEALRDVRAEKWRDADTYLAYLFYGDVSARFT